MGSKARLGSGKRIVATAVAASLLVVLLIAGLAFVNSIGAARVAENARSLHWANAALGTSSLTRAALVQRITFEGLDDGGLADEAAVAFAADQVESARSELEGLQAAAGDSPSAPYLIHFVAEVGAAIKSLEDGDVDGARDVVLSGVETRYMDLVASLKAEQDSIQRAISDNTAAASRTNGYVLFFLTLAVPTAAVLVYWVIARRQVREFKLQSELELDAERAVSKAKDTFIAGLSHELRTPLTSIYGFAEILTDHEAGDMEQISELSQIIANEASEMTRMVDDLLAASRMESTGLEIELSLTKVQDVVESAALAFERAGLEIVKPSASVIVETDAARLRHVLVNLLSNAATHGGDRIGVEVSEAAGTVDISVVDNGSGIPEDHLEAIFEGFVHNGAAPLLTGSVGLGLAVASRVASLLGGRLSYQRFAGRTYFTITIPHSAATHGPDRVESKVSSDPIDKEVEPGDESVADMIRALSR